MKKRIYYERLKFKKLLLTMKMILLLNLIALFHVIAADSYAQNTRLSLKANSATVEEVLLEIEKISDFYFLYNNKLVNVSRYVDVNFEDAHINEIIQNLFKGENIKYLVLDKQIILSPKDFGAALLNQELTVKGKVIDIEGNPFPGVNVVEKGTTNGAVTNLSGEYSISVSSTDATLSFSFVGYLTEEIEVTGRTQIDLTLVEDVMALDEVVIIGYGSIKKSDLTGAVSQVKSEEISAYPALGATQALQGRVAGLQISANNGEPGSSMKVRIRGGTSINSSSDPLYVVDGFPGGYMPPPEDIESIEVLKDASATAIYGSRGANGVIMVTTKKGKIGKTKVEFNTSYSFTKEINRFDLLNATQMAEYINESRINNGTDPANVPYPNPSSYGEGTDWQEEIFRNGGIQNYQLSFSGGKENMQFYVSGIVYDQKGNVINSDYARYSITSNVDIKATEKIKLGTNLYADRTIKSGVRSQMPTGGFYIGVITSAFKFEPTLPIFDENGVYTTATLNDPYDNPVTIATELINENINDLFQGNLYGEYSILPDLKWKSTMGVSTFNTQQGTYTPSTMQEAKTRGGIGSLNANKSTNLISENYLTYTKSIGVHDITTIAGYSYQLFKYSGFGANSAGYITDAGLYWNLGAGAELILPYSYISKSELASYYGRVNYKFNNKYMLTINARYDGSSRFANNNKWAFFPSGALAWNVKEESFMKSMEKVDQLKLRGSYGITGNQAISPYQSLARFGNVLTVIDGNIVNAVRPTTVANDNLSWESTDQTNIGFDLGLFNMHVLVNGDVYKMVTSDLLFSLPLPQYSGYSSLLSNIGKVENKGAELSVTTVNIDKKLKWETMFNISTNRNKVLELPDGKDILIESGPGHFVGLGTTGILREGEPVGSFYGYMYEGVLQSDSEALPGNPETMAGGEKYKDISGIDENGNQDYMPDGEISSADRTIIGNPHPDFIWGLNNTLSYGGFDLNIFFQGSHGNDLYSFSLMELDLLAGLNNATTKALDRWTPTNTNTDVPMAKARVRTSSTRFVYDGSYIRLKNISLGYNVHKNIVSRIGLNSVQISVSAQNILTFTKYEGLDPEVNFNTSGDMNSNRNLGLDYGSYPNTKSVTFGLKMVF